MESLVDMDVEALKDAAAAQQPQQQPQQQQPAAQVRLTVWPLDYHLDTPCSGHVTHSNAQAAITLCLCLLPNAVSRVARAAWRI